MNLKPETLAKFERAEQLIRDNPGLPQKIAIQRSGISFTYFFRIRKLFARPEAVCEAE